MTRAQIFTMLQGVNIPCAYHQFADGVVTAPPFLCFEYPTVEYTYADNANYIGKTTLTVELYADNRDFDLEEEIEVILTNNNLTFTKDSEYLDGEKMSVTIYQMEVFIDG